MTREITVAEIIEMAEEQGAGLVNEYVLGHRDGVKGDFYFVEGYSIRKRFLYPTGIANPAAIITEVWLSNHWKEIRRVVAP